MSYNNPSGEATYTYTNSGTLILDPATSGLIASSAATGSQYYAQNLTIPTGGAVVSGATIDDKGKLYTNQTVYNITVLSGGTLQRGGGGIGANNITVMSGGTMLSWNGGQAYWAGTWNIQSGANIFGYTDVYTDADGWLNYGGHGITGALNPYIKIRNIDVNSYLYVRGGGVSGAIVRGGATAASNAYLHFYSAGMSAYDVQIQSGGSFHIYAGNVKIWNIKGDDGARITFQANNSFGGRETTFAKGFFTNVGQTETYADQGTIYNWAKPSTGAAFYFYDITLDTGDATNQYIYLGTGAETRNFTIGGASGAKTGIVLGQAGQGMAIDTTATGAGGGITVNSSYYAIFGGTSNNVTAGHILLGGAGAGVANTSLSIIGDKFYGIEVKKYSDNSTYLKNVKLVSGLTAVDPIVSSGGSLVLGSGGSATGAVIHEGGTLQALKGGTVSGATLSSGYLYIMDYNEASETASVGRPAIIANNVDIEGGQVFLRGSNASGANLRLSKGIIYMQNAAHASGVTVTGGALSAYYNNVNPMDAATIHINDLTMAGGAADLYNYAQVDGATITAGTVAMTGTARLSGATVTGGTVTMNGGVVSGATFSDAGIIVVNSGASALGITIYGNATSKMLDLETGGYASGVTLVGVSGNTPSSNYIYLYGTAVIEDVTVDSGSIYLAGGGTARNLTVRNGAVPVARGVSAYISGAVVSGGSLHFQNGAKGQDVVVTGGILYACDNGPGLTGKGARVSGVDIVTGSAYFSAGASIYDLRLSGGSFVVTSTTSYDTTFVSGATITGGTAKVLTGALLNEATVNAGTVSASNATVRNATVNGGTLAVYYDGKIYDTIVGGGSVYLANHASASGAEINAGMFRLYKGATVSGATLNAGNLWMMDDNNASETASTGRPAIVAADVVQNGGTIFFRGSNASGANLRVNDGVVHIQNAAYVSGFEQHGGTVNMTVNGGVHPNDQPNTIHLLDAVIDGGTLNVYNHGDVSGIKMTGGTITIANGGVVSMAAEDTLNNAQAATGAHINYQRNKNSATIAGAETNIAASTFYYDGATTANGFSVVNGVVKNLGADDVAFRIGVGSGITVEDAIVKDSWRLSAFGDAVVSGAVISGGPTDAASIIMRDDSVIYNATLTGDTAALGGVINLYENAKASGTVIGLNGKVGIVGSDTEMEDTTLMAGGQLLFSATGVGADTGNLLTLDFSAGGSSTTINNLNYISNWTEIVLAGVTAGNTYTFATTGATDKYVTCYADMGLYGGSIKAGETINNIFAGTDVYSFNAAGTAITVTQGATMTDLATAGSISNGTVLANGGRAAKWTSNTTAEAGATYTVATNDISNEVWLEIDGTNLAGTTLFGAADEFYSGVINLYATGGAVINNLAAGAVAGGDIESVKLTIDSATVGLTYAGGFGAVHGAVETLIEDGTFRKDFYAGALVNRAKTGFQTGVGSISFTINGGEFSGNIYGASAIKAGDATFHAGGVGDVDITINGGETKKGSQACLFAGGYATGTTLTSNASVYEVGNINLSIDGGNWGEACGGRGVFGGIFASVVRAETENVNITISGGTMGNVYGGGWAQKGGMSIVGDVQINIAGGTVANVFGGGTTSNSGGSTVADDVTITVSAGTITGDIYAMGQGTTDSVTTAKVIFTGANDFSCGVYGYSYVEATDPGTATLAFDDYTGTFSGNIGGFADITISGDTEMVIDSAASISNTAWVFDFTERNSVETMLTWDGGAFAENSSVAVSFADDSQAAGDWGIAAMSNASNATFDLAIGEDTWDNLAYGVGIDDGSDWDGWGFTLDSGVLKFKNLA